MRTRGYARDQGARSVIYMLSLSRAQRAESIRGVVKRWESFVNINIEPQLDWISPSSGAGAHLAFPPARGGPRPEDGTRGGEHAGSRPTPGRGGGRSWRVPCSHSAPRGENRLGRGKYAAARRMDRAGGPVAKQASRAAWPRPASVGGVVPFLLLTAEKKFTCRAYVQR